MIELDNQRTPCTALFNKLNGAFVTVTSIPFNEASFDEEFFYGRPVDFKFGPNADILVGRIKFDEKGQPYDDFKVVAAEDYVEPITETQMNALAAQKITEVYPVTRQFNILSKAVTLLGEEAKLSNTDEFTALHEMMSFIEQCLEVNRAKKEFYQNDPNTVYITEEEQLAAHAERLEGAMYEGHGPNLITGGRIF